MIYEELIEDEVYYTYSVLCQGSAHEVAPYFPKNKTYVAVVHTHGNWSYSHNGEGFSPRDQAFAAEHGIPIYVFTPTKRLLRYDPLTRETKRFLGEVKINTMRAKILKISLLILLIVLIAFLVVWIVSVLPEDKGDYRIEDYAYEVDLFKYDSEKTYDEIHNIYDACWIATDVLSKCFPEERFAFLSTEYKRWVYYDTESDTWFVYFAPSDPDVLGGEYACIISSNGEVISCWGYK